MNKTYNSRVCCVPGCKTAEAKNRELKFYSFPGRAYEVDRKKKWIEAVRRKSSGQIPWVPTKSTRICSLHFVGGAKSNDPRQESYNPTIFPWTKGNKLAVNRQQKLDIRLLKIGSEQVKSIIINGKVIPLKVPANNSPPLLINHRIDVQIQKDFTDDLWIENPEPVISCYRDTIKHEASTQANIAIVDELKNSTPDFTVMDKIETKDVAAGEDYNVRVGFRGYSDIKDDATMIQLTGINVAFFDVLLCCLTVSPKRPQFCRRLSNEDKLLIFLMKLKLGLQFTALSCIFKISLKTVSTAFYKVLDCVFDTTKTWLFWPTREDIKETMPESFKNYQNCRAIIDCMEIPCETPPTEQRNLIELKYRSQFTVKILIAVTPSGFISFVSKAYGGKSNDEIIIRDSGFINLIEPGDEIMSVTEFPQIKMELLKRKSSLIMAPYTFQIQFSQEEVTEGPSVRIHVERAKERIKCFKILDHVPASLLPSIDKIVHVICVLCNK